VLRPERLEDELGGLEAERNLEVAWDELGHPADPRRRCVERRESSSPGPVSRGRL
jgi:hypothetical protein